jgi:hypothetical protein
MHPENHSFCFSAAWLLDGRSASDNGVASPWASNAPSRRAAEKQKERWSDRLVL